MPTRSGYHIRVQDGKVTECWDSAPPEGQDGWFAGVEITPDLIPNREIITTHTFDITKNPIEIVWGKRELSVEERKGSLIADAETPIFILENDLRLKRNDPVFAGLISSYEANIETAKAARDARVIQINAAVTHEDVDALM
ncbi:hypothetical protein EBU71_04100 [bacterium]|nr:hypothetical protein [Candidatus Elulimicrobium humile]